MSTDCPRKAKKSGKSGETKSVKKIKTLEQKQASGKPSLEEYGVIDDSSEEG